MSEHAVGEVAGTDRGDAAVEPRSVEALATELSEQLKVLAQAIEQSQTRADSHLEKSRTAFEQRMTESEARQTIPSDGMMRGWVEVLLQTGM